jgi:glycosyltransferase involved in cell wall biosynthesis
MTTALAPPKLLYITTVPQTLAFHTGQVSYLHQRGFAIHALASPGDLPSSWGEAELVTRHSVAMPRRITPLQDLWAIFQLWRQLRQIRPQIVHASTPKGGLLGITAAWLADVPVRLYHMRGLPFMTATGYKRVLLQWSEWVACRLAHQVLCVSPSLREVAIAAGLCPASKIKVLLSGSSNGVDAIARFNPQRLAADTRQRIRQQYNIPLESPVVGFVGRIVRDKGITELVTAWQVLRAEFPDLYLLVVGAFEPQDPLPPEIVQVLQQDDRIRLTHTMQETPPFYAAMDLLTLPTYREGFPNTPLEAAAMQLPVVATQIPGCVEAVQAGRTGTLVPARDAVALTQAIRQYLQQPELGRQQGQAGRDRVLQHFSQTALWQALHQEYLRLLQTQGCPIPSTASMSKALSL